MKTMLMTVLVLLAVFPATAYAGDKHENEHMLGFGLEVHAPFMMSGNSEVENQFNRKYELSEQVSVFYSPPNFHHILVFQLNAGVIHLMHDVGQSRRHDSYGHRHEYERESAPSDPRFWFSGKLELGYDFGIVRPYAYVQEAVVPVWLWQAGAGIDVRLANMDASGINLVFQSGVGPSNIPYRLNFWAMCGIRFAWFP